MNNGKKSAKSKPQVRQTLTSLYRLARANPILVRDNTIESTEYRSKKVQIPSTVTSLRRREKISKPIEITPVVPSADNRPDILKHSISNFKRNASTANRTKIGSHKLSETKNKQNTHNSRSNLLEAPKPRRSLSAQHFERKKHVPVPEIEREMMKTEVTQSLENIAEVSDISPIKKRAVTFQTPPPLNARQSISLMHSHKAIMTRAHSTPYHYKNSDLQSRLNDWLKKRGKSLSTFHHLKCFGVHHNQNSIKEDDENKENIEASVALEKSESYEALHIVPFATPKKSKEVEVLDAPKLKSVVRDALYDLHKLILEGYSLDQCEAWLAAIRQKYTEIEEEPEYWECRAAIERSRGNISCAVECLTTAITKGAEIEQVDESLDHLLKKFSILNIETPTKNTQESRTEGLTKVCNIFKSTLIQFAVREREMKKSQKEETAPKQYFATTVRRSTRLSRSSYVTTPGVQICNSLIDLDASVKEGLSFKSNVYIQ